MRMTRQSIVALALVVLAWPQVASAAVAQVYAHDFYFESGVVSVALGDHVNWTNVGGTTTHTVTSDLAGVKDPVDPPSPYFRGQLENIGGADTFDFAFDSAGTFAYHCEFHSVMRGKVAAGMTVTPTGIPHEFTVLWSNTGPIGIAFDVQVRKPRSRTWSNLASNTFDTQRLFVASRRGTYRFRARVKFQDPGTRSGWSPSATISRP